MGKHIWILVAAALCMNCGGSSQSAPAKEPESQPETSKAPESAEKAGDKAGGDKTGADKAGGDKAGGDKAGGDTGGSKAGGGGGGKKSCPELDKSTCKVTMGCVWNEIKKCVEETSGDQ